MDRFIKLAVLLLFSTMAWAGDVATFQNLGFSPDGAYFQFGIYGIDTSSQNPYAEIFTVNVTRNSFVPKSGWKTTITQGGTLGDDGKKALFTLLERAYPTRKNLKLSFENLGRLIYVRVVAEAQPALGKKVEFLDYQTGKSYVADLVQTVRGEGQKLESSFYIDLTIKDKSENVLSQKKVGNPQIWRKGVKDYNISQIFLTPGEKGLVLAIEKLESDLRDGVSVRYMVETLTL